MPFDSLKVVVYEAVVCMRVVRTLIIYMKEFLPSDWQRSMQFSGNTVQKRGNSCNNS